MSHLNAIESHCQLTAATAFAIGTLINFNRDGVTDLLWQNAGTNAVTLWQVTPGTAGFGYTTVNLTGLASPSQYEFQGLGDFNGDGNMDILWRSKPDAQSNYCLRMTLMATGLKILFGMTK